MSLALLQGYSSAEEDNNDDDGHHLLQEENSSEDEQNGPVSKTSRSYKPLFDPNPPSASLLPSAFDAFSEVAGPPRFLNNSVEDTEKEDGQRRKHGGRRNRKDKKDLPSGAVVESKPQLVGIHERVRSDIDGNSSQAISGSAQGGKRIATVGNPGPEDAAELLGMCVRCGIPKTYSHGKGVVCPMCNDRPPDELDKEPSKKRGSAMKEKEKGKRMRGQSSHATWKSESEMQLRQQFD
ncbi:uncharacterized protein LOC127260608 [Andrographis paniculata]|uniref:uncharacterized protein LOC127260608 n=1 Tax=Andrographis paniculata TaxID=175694 RepID=UPI0021E9AAF3|nr:uncharacterized protein LOC127260608 [Andrographis paniculata]XP_051144392.1 uncharacterized protein LOC127260608 [Andrographis paniculata]